MHGPLNAKFYLYFCGRIPVSANDIQQECTNVCGSSAWNLLHVTFLSSVILRWLPDFCEICVILTYAVIFAPIFCLRMHLF